MKEVKENYNTLQFPQIFDQCPTRESVIQWFHHQLHDTFRKLEGRQEQQPQAVVKIQKVLMKASLGQPLERSEEAVALSCGRFYQGDDSKPKLACPPNIVLEHVHLEVMGTYRMYDEGAALEFLVAAQLQRCHNNNEIVCFGQHPSSLRDKLKSTGQPQSQAQQSYYISMPNIFVNQSRPSDALPQITGTCVIKLHANADFLVIEKPSGRIHINCL